jgi:hypothetical protein
VPNLRYYIKLVEKQKSLSVYADKDGDLAALLDDRPFPCSGHFKFTKHPNGTFSIYSMSQVHLLKLKNYIIYKLLNAFYRKNT